VKKSRWIVYIVALTVVGFAGLDLLAQASDPANGTWELNLTKSKYASTPAPKSETRTIEVVGDRITYTARTIDAEGKTTVAQFTANYDGKEYPLKGNPNVDAISLKRIDRFITESTTVKAGKVVYRYRRVVSADGKVMTLTSQSTNAKGETLTDIQVYDKK
jgi:hypothetical protein